MTVFNSNTVEGLIERKYVPTLLAMGLSKKEAAEAIRSCYDQVQGGFPLIVVTKH